MALKAWAPLLVLYLAVGLLGIAIVNNDQNNALAFYGLIAAASLVLGWGSGSALAAVVAVALIPLALPFGDTNQLTGGDDTDAVTLLASIAAIMSALLILLAAGGRRLYDRQRHAATDR